ncbi:MAG: diguanylate cyclase [Cyanobacteria bacterium J06642_11]
MGEPSHRHIYRFSSVLTAHNEQSCWKHILLIENNLRDVISIKKMLQTSQETSEFKLFHADSLSMGLKYLRQGKFDAVLLDLDLPDSQGINSLNQLHQAFPQVPIIILTDSADERFAIRLIQQGAQAFLVKGNINSSWLKSTLTLSVSQFRHGIQQQQQQQQLEQSNQVLHRQITACNNELHRLKQELQRLSTLASTDGLTGIANRYGFEKCLEHAWDQAYHTQRPLSLIMIDLDYFKQFNDSYGHIQGDNCLRKVAQTLQQQLTPLRGTAARYGGEEFVAILPNTSVQSAVQIAESLRKGIQSLAIHHPSSRISQWVTASLGIASTVPTSKVLAADLVNEADQALYCSKKQGRDRIAYFQPSRIVREPISIRQ